MGLFLVMMEQNKQEGGVQKMVRASYNQMGELYDKYRDLHKIDDILEEFAARVPKKGKILDAGSGAGRPVAQFLTQRGFDYLGVDFSEKMLALARQNVPAATFQWADLLDLPFASNSFDGIISVFTLFHIERRYHGQLLADFYRILKPGGILLINTGIRESEGSSVFFGHPMYWSNHRPSVTLDLAKSAGFTIEFEGILRRGGESQYWIRARK